MIPHVLHFTPSEEANRLLVEEPMALLVGFALDQQVTVEKAFMGPLVIRERLGSLDASMLADADLDACFRNKPAVHRYPGAMAKRVHALAEHIRDEYDGDGEAVWRDATSSEDLLERLRALPGFGTMKVKAIAAVLAKQLDVRLAEPLVPWHPTLGDVTSPDGLKDYKAAKRLHKKEWEATPPAVAT